MKMHGFLLYLVTKNYLDELCVCVGVVLKPQTRQGYGSISWLLSVSGATIITMKKWKKKILKYKDFQSLKLAMGNPSAINSFW